MRRREAGRVGMLLGAAAMVAACGGGRDAGERASAADTAAAVDSGPRATVALSVDGLRTPESARFDPELGVWFVSNIDGPPLAKDGNGFISRLTRDGKMDSLRFIAAGRGGAKLDAPKGLAIQGDTLWVADIDVARAFDKRTGKPIATVSMAGRANFLNDAAVGPDGAIYFTDTGIANDGKGGMGAPGANRVFRVLGRKATIALEFKDKPGVNGIVWDSTGARFLMVPFGDTSIYQWVPGDTAPRVVAQGPGMMDGIEPLGDRRFVVTSWADSSLFLLQDDKITRLMGGLPGPADIGLDLERGRIAVPLFTENRLTFVELRL
ncbi:MAG: SMP-30/gluconolactonase/LRE family protein [Gemmatimonadales bacterium]